MKIQSFLSLHQPRTSHEYYLCILTMNIKEWTVDFKYVQSQMYHIVKDVASLITTSS